MKKKLQQNGPGDRAIDEFLRGIAAVEGGRVMSDVDQFQVEFDGRQPSFIVKMEPTTPDEWRLRFEHVEKVAAIILNHPPVMYSAKWPPRSGKPERDILRASIGLSLSVGEPTYRRFVVTHEAGRKQAVVAEGGHLPADISGRSEPWSKSAVWGKQRKAGMIQGIVKACNDYQESAQVADELDRLAARRRTELAQIEQLYARRLKAKAQLYGLPESGTVGSASVEAEQRRLQQTVFERYSVRILVQVLSIGQLEGSVPPTIVGL